MKNLKKEAAKSMHFSDFRQRISPDPRETPQETKQETAEEMLARKIREKREQLKQGGSY